MAKHVWSYTVIAFVFLAPTGIIKAVSANLLGKTFNTSSSVALAGSAVMSDDKPVLKLCPSPVENKRCVLQCIIPNRTSSGTFQHPPGTSQGICPENGSTCESTNYRIFKQYSIISLVIDHLDKNRDEGKWICCLGGSCSDEQTLNVSSPHGTQNESQVTSQYPVTNINAEEGQDNFLTNKTGCADCKISPDNALTAWDIAGIVIGIFILVLVVLVVCFIIRRRKKCGRYVLPQNI